MLHIVKTDLILQRFLVGIETQNNAELPLMRSK